MCLKSPLETHASYPKCLSGQSINSLMLILGDLFALVSPVAIQNEH